MSKSSVSLHMDLDSDGQTGHCCQEVGTSSPHISSSPPIDCLPGTEDSDIPLSTSSAIPPYIQHPQLESRIHHLNLLPRKQTQISTIPWYIYPHSSPVISSTPSDHFPLPNPQFPATYQSFHESSKSQVTQSQSKVMQSQSVVVQSQSQDIHSRSQIDSLRFPNPSYGNLSHPQVASNEYHNSHSPAIQSQCYSCSNVPIPTSSNTISLATRTTTATTLNCPDSSINTVDDQVPSIKPFYTKKISEARAAGIRPNDLYFRPVEPEDLDDIQQLHKEWFPIKYEKSFFDSVCRGDIYSLAAVYSQSPNIENKSNVEHRSNGNNTCDHAEYIAGVITVSQRPNIHLLPDDVKFVSRGDVAEAIRSTPPDPFQQGDNAQLIRKDFKVDRRFHLAYILTLGVAENFRGIGLASTLVRRAIDFFVESDPEFQSIYLHVAGYNYDAIRLYNKLGFRLIYRSHNFYMIGGRRQDALLYAYYCTTPPPQAVWNRFRYSLPSGHSDFLRQNVFRASM